MSEIQYQNRVLLRKMLQIDLKEGKLNPKTMKKTTSHADAVSNPNGLNSWDSLNRANRIKDLARIVDGNRAVLERLQNTSSNYDHK